MSQFFTILRTFDRSDAVMYVAAGVSIILLTIALT